MKKKTVKSPKAKVSSKLKAEPEEHAKTLAEAIVSDMLSRDVLELLEPARLARAHADGLRAMAESEGLEPWIEEQLREALDWAREHFDGTLEEHLPEEVAQSVMRCSARPYKLDPKLVGSVLRHEHVRGMIREGLQGFLMSFGRSLSSSVSGSEHARAFAGILDMARSMATMVRSEIDRQLEGRVREFVEETLSKGVDKWTSSLSTEKKARKRAASREKITEVLLDQPVRHYIDIPQTAGVAEIASTIAEEIRHLSAWEDLDAKIEASIETALAPLEGSTLLDILEGSGLVESWRPSVEALLAEHLVGLFESGPFQDWLLALESSRPTTTKNSRSAKNKRSKSVA